MERTLRPIRSVIAGGLSFIVATSTTFYAVLTGTSFVHSQAVDSILGPYLWPVTAGVAIVLTLTLILVTLFIALVVINKIGTPKIRAQTEYDLVGLGGLLGTAGATVTVGWALLTGHDESVLAFGAVALPTAYTFYQIYTPSESTNTKHENAGSVTPDKLREKSERWNEQPTHNPAFPPGKGPNKSEPVEGTQQANSATEQREAAPDAAESRSCATSRESVDLSEMEYRWVTETNVSFADVGGMDDLKEELRTEVLKPLTTHREKAKKLGVSAPNIIFHGPPGTGKTYIAKALATELDLPFAQLSGADLQSKWINESATKVQTLFAEAKEIAATEGGAVIFLDEVDSVLKDRSAAGSSHEEDRKVVNEFLNHLEETKNHDIVFVGATNRMDALDEAGIRSGRIDKKIRIGKPDTDAREAILQAQLNEMLTDLSSVEIERVAIATEGMVAADLESVVNDAAKEVLARDGDKIQTTDLQKAIAS